MPIYLLDADGNQSPQPVYPPDLDAWLANGWSLPKESSIAPPQAKARIQQNKPVYLLNEDGELSAQPVSPAHIEAWLEQGWKLPPEEENSNSESELAHRLSPIYLYKNGESSKQPVHPQDQAAWMAQGWVTSLELSKATPEQVAEAKTFVEPVASAESTTIEEDLRALYANEGWQSIKREAEALGIEKHEDGWEETIPAIAAAMSA